MVEAGGIEPPSCEQIRNSVYVCSSRFVYWLLSSLICCFTATAAQPRLSKVSRGLSLLSLRVGRPARDTRSPTLVRKLVATLGSESYRLTEVGPDCVVCICSCCFDRIFTRPSDQPRHATITSFLQSTPGRPQNNVNDMAEETGIEPA